jgi:hypothetical protein
MALAGCDHTPNDFNDLLIRVGASVEVFLKDHVYGGVNRRNFVALIDDLYPLGLSAESQALLHDLRLAYNEAKHNPSYTAEIQSVAKVLGNAESALKEVTHLSVGTMQTPVSPSFRRLMWFAAWDHVIGGDTEVGIFLPAPVSEVSGHSACVGDVQDLAEFDIDLVAATVHCSGRWLEVAPTSVAIRLEDQYGAVWHAAGVRSSLDATKAPWNKAARHSA